MASIVQPPPPTVNLTLPASPVKKEELKALWYVVGFAATAAAVVATMGLIGYVLSGLATL